MTNEYQKFARYNFSNEIDEFFEKNFNSDSCLKLLKLLNLASFQKISEKLCF